MSLHEKLLKETTWFNKEIFKFNESLNKEFIISTLGIFFKIFF